MSSLGDRRLLVLTMVVLAGLGVAACTGSPAPSAATTTDTGHESGPVLVRGRIADANGGQVGAAQLMLQVFDHANSQPGTPMALAFDRTYTAGLDGIFEVRLTPDARLAAFAAQNGNFVNFTMTVISRDGALIVPAMFSREIVGTGWGGDIPILVITPSGVQQGNDGGVPTLLPAAT